MIMEILTVKLRQPIRYVKRFIRFAVRILYETELIKLSDGGTIALDWHIDESGKGKPRTV